MEILIELENKKIELNKSYNEIMSNYIRLINSEVTCNCYMSKWLISNDVLMIINNQNILLNEIFKKIYKEIFKDNLNIQNLKEEIDKYFFKYEILKICNDYHIDNAIKKDLKIKQLEKNLFSKFILRKTLECNFSIHKFVDMNNNNDNKDNIVNNINKDLNTNNDNESIYIEKISTIAINKNYKINKIDSFYKSKTDHFGINSFESETILDTISDYKSVNINSNDNNKKGTEETKTNLINGKLNRKENNHMSKTNISLKEHIVTEEQINITLKENTNDLNLVKNISNIITKNKFGKVIPKSPFINKHYGFVSNELHLSKANYSNKIQNSFTDKNKDNGIKIVDIGKHFKKNNTQVLIKKGYFSQTKSKEKAVKEESY